MIKIQISYSSIADLYHRFEKQYEDGRWLEILHQGSSSFALAFSLRLTKARSLSFCYRLCECHKWNVGQEKYSKVLIIK